MAGRKVLDEQVQPASRGRVHRPAVHGRGEGADGGLVRRQVGGARRVLGELGGGVEMGRAGQVDSDERDVGVPRAEHQVEHPGDTREAVLRNVPGGGGVRRRERRQGA